MPLITGLFTWHSLIVQRLLLWLVHPKKNSPPLQITCNLSRGKVHVLRRWLFQTAPGCDFLEQSITEKDERPHSIKPYPTWTNRSSRLQICRPLDHQWGYSGRTRIHNNQTFANSEYLSDFLRQASGTDDRFTPCSYEIAPNHTEIFAHLRPFRRLFKRTVYGWNTCGWTPLLHPPTDLMALNVAFRDEIFIFVCWVLIM